MCWQHFNLYHESTFCSPNLDFNWSFIFTVFYSHVYWTFQTLCAQSALLLSLPDFLHFWSVSFQTMLIPPVAKAGIGIIWGSILSLTHCSFSLENKTKPKETTQLAHTLKFSTTRNWHFQHFYCYHELSHGDYWNHLQRDFPAFTMVPTSYSLCVNDL